MKTIQRFAEATISVRKVPSAVSFGKVQTLASPTLTTLGFPCSRSSSVSPLRDGLTCSTG